MKDFKNMDVEEFVEYFNIALHMNEKNLIVRSNIPTWKANATVCVVRKEEVLEFLKTQKARKEEERKAKDPENVIAGLRVLKEAIAKLENYYYLREKRFEDERLSSLPIAKPNVDLDALKARYPRAAAYLKANAWSCASHYAKAAAGRRACERILAGEDYEVVLAEMEEEWSDYVNEHMWEN